jgi:hypothetical protein
MLVSCLLVSFGRFEVGKTGPVNKNVAAFYSDHANAMEGWSKCIDINIKGVLNGIVAGYDQMIMQGRGHVINLLVLLLVLVEPI